MTEKPKLEAFAEVMKDPTSSFSKRKKAFEEARNEVRGIRPKTWKRKHKAGRIKKK